MRTCMTIGMRANFDDLFIENAMRHAHSGGMRLQGDALIEGILYYLEVPTAVKWETPRIIQHLLPRAVTWINSISHKLLCC